MPSTIISWAGRVADDQGVHLLRSYVEDLAGRHAGRWQRFDRADMPRFSQALSDMRSAGQPEIPLVRAFDETVEGAVVLHTDVHPVPAELISAARRAGVRYERQPQGSPHALLFLDSVQLRGVQFRLFDPRALYPGHDILSFVVLTCPALPELDGRLVRVDDSAWTARYENPAIRRADYYLQCPFLHLRYYLYDWLRDLLAWTKTHFAADLHCAEFEQSAEFAQAELRAIEPKHRDDSGMRNHGYDALVADFEREAMKWVADVRSWR